MVPKFTTSNCESLMGNLKSDVSHMDGIHGAAIYCLLREVDGTYNDNWKSRREKLNNYLLLVSNQFKHYSDLIYQL